MARDLYQKTMAIRSDGGPLVPLAGVGVTVFEAGTTNLADIFQSEAGLTAGPRPGSGATGINPFITGDSGAIEFFAEAPEPYDVQIEDTESPARFTTDTFRWNASASADDSVPGIKLIDGSVLADKLEDEIVLAGGNVVGERQPGGGFLFNVVPSGITNAHLLADTIQAEKFSPDLREQARITTPTEVRSGRLFIAEEGTRSTNTWGPLNNGPDVIPNVLVAENSLLRIKYSALVKSTGAFQGTANIRVGPSGVQGRLVTAHFQGVPSESLPGFSENANDYDWLYTTPKGSALQSVPFQGGATLGNAARDSLQRPTWVGDFVTIEVGPGVYTVGVEYFATTGTVTAKERRLWVESVSFVDF